MIIKTINHNLPLRVKVTQILKKFDNIECNTFINHLRVFNQRIVDYSNSKKELDKYVTESQRFSYDKKSEAQWDIHYIPDEQFNNNYSLLSEKLRKELSHKELDLIDNNKDHYIKEKNIRDNVVLIQDDSLTDKLNQEENKNIVILKNHRKNTSCNNNKKGVAIENESTYSRNKRIMDKFHKIVQTNISLNKKERLTQENHSKQREIFLKQLHKDSHEQLNNLLLQLKKQLNNSPTCLIAHKKPLLVKPTDKPLINKLKNKIKKPNELSLPNIFKSNSSVDSNKDHNFKMIKSHSFASSLKINNQCSNNKNDVWIKQINQIIKESLKEKNKCFFNAN